MLHLFPFYVTHRFCFLQNWKRTLLQQFYIIYFLRENKQFTKISFLSMLVVSNELSNDSENGGILN